MLDMTYILYITCYVGHNMLDRIYIYVYIYVEHKVSIAHKVRAEYNLCAGIKCFDVKFLFYRKNLRYELCAGHKYVIIFSKNFSLQLN